MSRPAPGAAELDQALEGLGAIAALTGEGHEVFRVSPDRRLALAFLWVNVGSALKQFCRARGISQGSSPFPGPIGLRDRLCYQHPADLSARILWDTCTGDTRPLAALLTDLRRALQDQP